MKRAILTIIVVVVGVIGGPLATIWSLNTLFGLAIEYTFYNLLAALFLSALVAGSKSK